MERRGPYWTESDGITETSREDVTRVGSGEMGDVVQIAASYALGRRLSEIEQSQVYEAQIADDSSGVSPRLNCRLETVDVGKPEERRVVTFGKPGEKQASFGPKPGVYNAFVITYKSPVPTHSEFQ